MRLTAYRIEDPGPSLRPARPRRAWMDATTERFIYRCLPLTIANQHGWEILCPCSFEALWTGGRSLKSVQVLRLSGEKWLPHSHFGEGVLTFHPGHIFRTEEPYQLYVTGPVNIRKDGIVPLTGIVESDWLPFTFTMNWVFTRVGVPVRFEEGEPFCHIFPITVGVVEEVDPEIRDLQSVPELHRIYHEWSQSRDAFNRQLKVKDSYERKRGWQRFYLRGTLHSGDPAAREHRTTLRVKEFLTVPNERSDISSTGASTMASANAASHSACPYAPEQVSR